MRSSIRLLSMALAVIMALTCVSICASAAGEVKSGIGFVTASALRLRSEPNTSCETLDVAYNGEVVVVTAKLGDWYKVIYDLQEGYMHANYLSVLDRENAELGYGRVNANSVNLRTGPSTDYTAINQANIGNLVYIIGLNCGWYKVIYGEDICYIRSDYVDLTEVPYENIASMHNPLFFRGGVSIGVAPSASVLNSSSNAPEYDYDDNYGGGNDDNYGDSSDDDYTDDNDGGYDDGYVSETAYIGQQMAEKALTYEGYPYVWGGASPNVGFDCSGLVYYIAQCFGYYVPHGSTSQYAYGTYVEKSDLQPGDFVFFENTYTEGISHVGIYVGNGNFIHASGTDVGVEISSLNEYYYIEHYYGARRIY